jgi:PKD repeat protein
MRILKHIIFVFLLAGIFSCEKKKYPENVVENDAVFFIKGTADYNPLTIVAGENDYYMYSSFIRQPGNIYEHHALFKQTNCVQCRNSLEVIINDARPALGEPYNVDSALKARTYGFSDQVSGPGFEVAFEGNYSSPGDVSYHWDFGDGTISNLLNPSHVYVRGGTYRVCLTITGANGCTGIICNEIVLREHSFVASINAAATADRTFQFSASVLGSTAKSYLWNFGDGEFSEAAFLPHTFPHDGSYPVQLRVIDVNDDTTYTSYNVVTKKDKYSCMPNFKVLSVSTSKKAALSTIILTWTDASGNVFSSDKTWQLPTSYFEVIRVEDYEQNEQMQKTKKLHVRFSCIMSNGQKVIPFDNAQGVICVSYP